MKADGDNREIIEETYEEIETELLQKIDGLEKQLEMTVEHRNTRIEVNRIAKTALDIFRDFLEKDKLDKGDLSLIIDKIIVFENKEEGTNKIEIKLKADIQMLLETGTLTEEELEESGYRGKVVNFNWDIESNLSAQIVQKVRNQRDKAFGVNVICEGDPLEIYTAGDGEVIFKKYSPIGELSTTAVQYAEAMVKHTTCPVVICDRDHCVAVAGVAKREALERRLSRELEDIVESRSTYIFGGGNTPTMPALEGFDRAVSVAVPILAAGDISGAVILLLNEERTVPTETDINLAKVAAGFLAKQMEE